MYRGDPLLLSRTDLRAPLSSPSSASSLFLGAGAVQPIAADLNGDGVEEILFLRQGRLIAVTLSGTPLIDTFYGATEIAAVSDLDAGAIVLINSYKRLLLVLNFDGSLRWQYRFPEYVELSSIYIKIAELSPDPGLELVVFPDHTKTELDARGYFFTSSGRLYANPLVPALFGGQLNFPQLAVADLDGDGLLEVVVVGRPKLMLYSGAGKLIDEMEFREGDLEGRHYGLLKLADVDADLRPEAIVLADEIPILPGNGKQHAITVFSLRPTLKKLWSLSLQGEKLRAPLTSVLDVDRDGRSEIAVNVWNGQRQQIRVYSGAGSNGLAQLLYTIPDHFLWEAADYDQNGVLDLLTTQESVETPALNLSSRVSVLQLTSQDGALSHALLKSLTGQLLTSRPGMDLTTGISSNTRSRLLLNGRNFLLYAQKEDGVYLQEYQLFQNATRLRLKKVLDSLRPGQVRSVLSNGLYLVNRETAGQITGELLLFSKVEAKQLSADGKPVITGGSGFNTEPRVGDVDGDGINDLLVRVPGGVIQVLSYDFDQLSVKYTLEGNREPVLERLLGTSRQQILTTISDAGRLRLQAYDITSSDSGRVRVKRLWGRTFDAPASTPTEIVTGSFSGRAGKDVYLSTPRGFSTVLSGLDGSPLWTRQDVYNFDNHTSVRDFNADGREDLFIVSDNRYRIVDGGHGADLLGPMDVSFLGAAFYSTPILAGENEVLFVGPSTAAKTLERGRRLWDFSRVIDGKFVRRQIPEILMGLADLGNGGGLDRIGGNFGPDDLFFIYEYETGLLAARTPHQPLTETVSLDLDGDRKDEFVFGTVDGQIVAVKATDGSTLWTLDTGYFTGSPIFAVLGQQRRPCLIYTTGDGSLKVMPL